MKRTKLVAARARQGWTLEQASERIGCAPNTLSRWELGLMTPSAYNKARLHAVYGLTDEELGLAEDTLRLAEHPKSINDLQAFLKTDLTMRLMALVFTPPRCNPLRLQKALSQTIEELTMNTSHEAGLTRREALRRLAMLPVLFSIGGTTQWPLEDTLSQCAASITACDYLSKGNYEDLSLALSTLSTYLPTLKTIVKESSRYRQEAANLIAQGYLVKHVLVLHVGNPNEATNYGRLAVTYSKESGDMLLQLTALRRLTWSYLQDKQPQQALRTIEQADYLIEHSRIPLPPHICSGIYSTLAVIQAKNGVSVMPALSLARESFFAVSEDGYESGHTNFTYAQLMRNDGLARYHQGSYKDALDSFAQVIDPNTLSPKVPMAVRTQVELFHYQTMATLKSPTRDMDQALAFWTKEAQGAVALRSQKCFDEAYMAYEVMEGVWPNEPRIKELRDLIVRW